ncbi:MAG: hypothetical protein ACD_58C00120G0005 [uncultured bacterium]|nr:MAG: hypothetical protein ACD_58C00120G0005 [uncultured bacterium]
MHKEILTQDQIKNLPIIKSFSKDFGLVGGTAIALHIGHRESIDFDLFSLKKFGNLSIKNKINKKITIDEILVNESDELTFIGNNVRFTFFHYPYKIDFSENFEGIKLPNLLTLSVMKVHALGQRAKWKDYVDLYFIIKDYHSIKEIIKRAQEIFGNEFNEKIFRTQLAYFKDIDKSEEIIWKKGFRVDDKTIEKELIKFSLQE